MINRIVSGIVSIHDLLGDRLQVHAVTRIPGVGAQVHTIDGVQPHQLAQVCEDVAGANPKIITETLSFA